MQSMVSKMKTDIESAVAGTLDMSEVDRIAALGASGTWKNNASRDLKNQLASPLLQSARHCFQAPLRSHENRLVVKEYMTEVLLPFELFAAIYEQFPDKFEKRITGPSGAIEEFWGDMEHHPAVKSHPMRMQSDWRSKVVPLSMHGDDVPVAGVGKSWARLLNIYSWTSLVGKGGTLDMLFFIYAVFVHLQTKETQAAVWKVLVWAFTVLASGRWPTHDAWGTAYPPQSKEGLRAGSWFAGGYRAIIFALRGDLDYFAKSFGLNHYGSARPCCRCPANNTEGDPLCWTDFRRGLNQWMAEMWEPQEWEDAHPGRHLIFSIPGVSIRCVYFDWLHIKHLGVDQYAYGSALWLLCYNIMEGRFVLF